MERLWKVQGDFLMYASICLQACSMHMSSWHGAARRSELTFISMTPAVGSIPWVYFSVVLSFGPGCERDLDNPVFGYTYES